MKASVIISVRNDHRIVQCLSSIFEYGTLGLQDEFEVIVIENSQEPVLAARIQAFPVVYLLEQRQGMGYARAKGIARAEGEFLVFTDADCVVSEGWLPKLLKPFSSPSVGIVGGPIAKLNPVTFTERAQRDLVIGGQHEVQYLPSIYPRPYVVTANAAYRTADVKQVGGIDPNFASGGDVDLAWRVGDLGYEAVIAHDALVFHACRPTPEAVFRQFFRYSMGHAQLFKKFKNRTGKKACLNAYPFIGCARVMPILLRALIRAETWNEKQLHIGEVGFQIIEYIALIAGAAVGAVRTRALYI
jgi:GT2 family glycosyltransferase